MPTEARAQVAYEGRAVAAGSMDVRELAPALLSLGDLLQAANRTINGNRAVLVASVESDFRRGSFEISFGLEMVGAAQQALSFFGVDTLKTAKEIAEYVGLITGEQPSLIAFLKWLKGRKPVATTSLKAGENSVIVKVDGDHNEVTIDKRVYLLARDQPTRRALSGVLKPVRAGSVDQFEVRQDGAIVETVTAADLPSFAIPTDSPEASSAFEPTYREQIVEVIKPSFQADLRWVFSLGGGENRFGAVMKDADFLARVESGQRIFGKGDLLRVSLKSTQHLGPEGLTTEHEVLQVLEEFRTPRPGASLLPDVDE